MVEAREVEDLLKNGFWRNDQTFGDPTSFMKKPRNTDNSISKGQLWRLMIFNGRKKIKLKIYSNQKENIRYNHLLIVKIWLKCFWYRA